MTVQTERTPSVASRHITIVGAGPVGLTLALYLATHDRPVTVIERQPMAHTTSRASTFHPATLDLLDQLGIVDELRAHGREVTKVQWRDQHDVFAEMDYAQLAGLTKHPFRLHVELSQLTALLYARLAQCGNAQVLLGQTLRDVHPATDRVDLMVASSSTGEVTRYPTDYLVGADGAHSVVRESQHIPFVGASYPTQALRVITSTPLDSLIDGLAPLSYLRDAATQSCSLLALPDHWRLIFRVPPPADGTPAAELAAPLVAAALPAIAADIAIDDAHYYPLAKRVVPHFRQGRTMLIGDAAHITSTAGGLNVNAGIHDAMSLGEALLRVFDGASESLLGEWATTRRSVMVNQVIPLSEARVAGVQDGNRTALTSERARLAGIAADPAATRAYLARASLLDTSALSPASSERRV